MSEQKYTVKLGKDSWTKWAAIRIEFFFPKDVIAISHFDAHYDQRLRVHFLDASKYPLSWFVDKTPLQIVRKLYTLRRAADLGYSEILDVLQRYFENATAGNAGAPDDRAGVKFIYSYLT